MQVMRGAKRKGARYFGPYSHAWAIRETVDLLLRVFPMRTCSTGVFKRAGQIGRPCLLGYIGKCSAPCVGRVERRRAPRASSRTSATSWPATPTGSSGGSSARCRRPPAELDFERAARLRDDIGALEPALEKQRRRARRRHRRRRVRLAEDELEAAVQVFHVRGGRVRGQRGWVVEKVEDADHRRPGRAPPAAGVRRRGAPRPCRARSSCPAARRTPTLSRSWLGEPARRAGSTCGCRSAATSGR